MTEMIFSSSPGPGEGGCSSHQDESVQIDHRRGGKAAGPVYAAFRAGGARGQNDVPGYIMPAGVTRGSREHLLFITLTAAVDDQGGDDALWRSSRLAYENPAVQYLFEPVKLNKAPFKKIIRDLQKTKLSRKTIKDAQIWTTISTIFLMDYDSDPRNLLAAGNFEYEQILRILLESRHGKERNRKPDFPNLREPEIRRRWFQMLRDDLAIQLKGMETAPIPVDIHIARSTLSLGIVKGCYEGPLQNISSPIREAWCRSVEGVARPDGLPMIPLDLVEPLRRLSRWGCSNRDAEGTCAAAPDCPCKICCAPGLIEINAAKEILKFTIS